MVSPILLLWLVYSFLIINKFYKKKLSVIIKMLINYNELPEIYNKYFN